ncbi:hypothetical protein QUF64_10080 [Anaerolineales bacterium HSG6]|nr:hypothetical protein [Anaerolineales bacterium HSG6]
MPIEYTVYGLDDDSPDLFGIWQAPSDMDAVSFSVGDDDAPDEDEVVWSVSLPDDPILAQASLNQQLHLMQSNRSAMAQAKETMQILTPRPVEDSVSFSVGDEAESPEMALQRNMARLQGHDVVSFGVNDEEDDWSGTVDNFQKFMTQLFRLMKPSLQTETKIGQVLMAQSVVSLTGDINTTWYRGTTVSHTKLHNKTLSLSMASRTAMLQLVAQITAGATVLAVKFNLPGGQLAALPAAWKYIQDVMKQSKKMALLQRELTKTSNL